MQNDSLSKQRDTNDGDVTPTEDGSAVTALQNKIASLEAVIAELKAEHANAQSDADDLKEKEWKDKISELQQKIDKMTVLHETEVLRLKEELAEVNHYVPFFGFPPC